MWRKRELLRERELFDNISPVLCLKHCAWLAVDIVLSVPRTWLIVRFPEALLTDSLYKHENVSQPTFQWYHENGTQFDQSVIVAILHYSANLVLALLCLSKLRSWNMCIIQMQNSRQWRVQILEHLTCNFNRTRVLLYVSPC